MTKQLVLIGTFMLSILSMSLGQIKTPNSSPRTTIQQNIGLTSVELDYSRPRLKGRHIFKDIIPYATFWRIGANQTTKISFNKAVKISNKLIEAGEYALLCIPQKQTWTFLLYQYESSNWNSYTQKNPVLQFDIDCQTTNDKMESLLLYFDDIQFASACLNVQWDHLKLSIPITTDENEKIINTINNEIHSASSMELFRAASYLQQTNQHLEQALKLIQQSIDPEKPTFFQKRVEALILADLGRYQEAVDAALISSNLAMQRGNLDVVRINQRDMYPWSKQM